ncbi:MAG: NUDIX hydrolase [Parachlamydiaceae bacterium]|nr:MAG: NUDIX hydrolase [Parachlamydiaceae bacterium]
MDKFLVVVECAIEFKEKFLFIKRPKGVHAEGLLSFPGGKVESEDGKNNNDILLQAVKREVFEEVGLNLVDPIHFLTSSYFIDSHDVKVLDVIFHCEIKNSTLEITPSRREVPEYYWLTVSEVLSHQDAPVWLKHYISLIH